VEAILTSALCGVRCGADTGVESEGFGAAKADWFATFLDRPHGLPSHDTVGRVFCALDPEQCERCSRAWTQGRAGARGTQVMALDGQALRRAHNAGDRPWQGVRAWAREARLVLAQRAVPDTSPELSAVPEVLAMLAVEGCAVVSPLTRGAPTLIAPPSARPTAPTRGLHAKAIRGAWRRMSRPSSPTRRVAPMPGSPPPMIGMSTGDRGASRGGRRGLSPLRSAPSCRR